MTSTLSSAPRVLHLALATASLAQNKRPHGLTCGPLTSAGVGAVKIGINFFVVLLAVESEDVDGWLPELPRVVDRRPPRLGKRRVLG